MLKNKPKIPVVVLMYRDDREYHRYERNFFALPRVGDILLVDHYGNHRLEVFEVNLEDKHDENNSKFIIRANRKE